MRRLHLVIDFDVAKAVVAFQASGENRMRTGLGGFIAKLVDAWIFDADFIEHRQIFLDFVVAIVGSIFVGSDFVAHFRYENFECFTGRFGFGLLFAGTETGAIFQIVDRYRCRIWCGGIFQFFEFVCRLLLQCVLNVLVQDADIALAIRIHDPFFARACVFAQLSFGRQNGEGDQFGAVGERRSLQIFYVLLIFGEFSTRRPRSEKNNLRS